MTNPIDIDGGSYTASEIIAAIAASNDPTVDLTEVTTKLDAISTQLATIDAKLLTLPTNWSIH